MDNLANMDNLGNMEDLGNTQAPNDARISSDDACTAYRQEFIPEQLVDSTLVCSDDGDKSPKPLMIQSEFHDPSYVMDAVLFVELRFLTPPVPSPEEDTVDYREAVADWNRLMELNEMPHAYRFQVAKPPVYPPLDDIATEPWHIMGARIRYMEEREYRNGLEAVRTPVSHFLEDWARLRWAEASGFPTYACTLANGCEHPLNFDISHEADRGLWLRSSVEPDMKAHGWQYRIVLTLHTGGKLLSCHDYVINMGMEVAGFLRKDETDAPVEEPRNRYDRSVRHDSLGGFPKESLPHFVGTWPPKAPFPRDRGTSDYYKHSTWKDMAGRNVKECSLAELPSELMALWLSGWPGVFVKSVHCKRGTWVVKFPAQGTPGVTQGQLFGLVLDADMDGGAAGPQHFLSTGRESTLVTTPRYMLQELVNFWDEYRFFVVDGHIVGGTPVRRADTILASAQAGVREGRLRPFMCGDRKNEAPVHDRKRVAAYARAARKLLPSLWRHFPYRMDLNEQDFVLDMGTNADTGAIIPVEINSLSRAGTYGLDPAVPYDALLRVMERHVRAWRMRVLDYDATTAAGVNSTCVDS